MPSGTDDLQHEYLVRLTKIEAALKTALPDTADERWIRDVAGNDLPVGTAAFDRINAPARALLERGGKRWRPLVMQLCCELAGGSEEALPLAALVELAHNGSLIVDDIEDGAEERRGEPAIHLLFGTDMAVNTGNFLYFLPSYLLERIELQPERLLMLYRVYLRYMRRLHLGQGLDIQWHGIHKTLPTQSEYLTMCRMKTGCLAAMGAELGAVAGGGDGNLSAGLGGLMEDLGVAFQIFDDVNNLTTGNPGKRRGDDIVEGKKSLPVILHLNRKPEDIPRFAELFSRASEAGIDDAGEMIEVMIGLLETSESIGLAAGLANGMIRDVREGLAVLCPDSLPRRLLLGLMESFLGSEKDG